MKYATLFGGLFVLATLVATSPASAARAVPEKAREAEATDVFVGTVTDIYFKSVTTTRNGTGSVEKRYLVEVAVEEVAKGGLVKGDVCYVRAWRLVASPHHDSIGMPPCGEESGHDPIPKSGDRVRVFAVRGAYTFMPQADRGYAAVYPTGFEVVQPPAK